MFDVKHDWLAEGLGELPHASCDSSGGRDVLLACVPLMLKRGTERVIMPAAECDVRQGDEILMCSTPGAKRRIEGNLSDIYTIEHLATGVVPPRAYAMRRLQSASR